MNIYLNLKSSKKRISGKVLDLLNFNDLLFDSDILLYDDTNEYDESYDYVITNDKLNDEYNFYKNDLIDYF